MFFEFCLLLFVIYSFASQLFLLFSHTLEFGVRSVAEYPAVVEQEEHALRLARVLVLGNTSADQVASLAL